jgi:hypothetical protein
VVQVPVNQVIDVVTVRHRFVPAARPVPVSILVFAAVMLRGAAARIGGADIHSVFLDAAGAVVVQMAVVQVIDMTVMLDADVAATWAVLMRVVGMVGMRVTH